jgi:hypothetical protein
LRKSGVALRLPPHSRLQSRAFPCHPHRTTGLKGRNIIAQGKGADRRPPPWVATPPVALGAAALLPPIQQAESIMGHTAFFHNSAPGSEAEANDLSDLQRRRLACEQGAHPLQPFSLRKNKVHL